MIRNLAVFGIVVLLLLPSSIAENKVTKERNWTIIIYGCYDVKDLDFFEQIEDTNIFNRAVKDKKVDIGMLVDTWNGSFRGHAIFDSKGKFKICSFERIDEVNTGNSSTLTEFILYCKHAYPAKKYLLIVNGHGLGPFGVCPDYHTNNFTGEDPLSINFPDRFKDTLTIPELGRAIRKAGGVDILFQVSCDLGCIESAYELKDCVKIYISLESSGYYYFPQIAPWFAFSRLMKTFSSINDEEKDEIHVAKEMIESFRDSYPYRWDPFYWVGLTKLLLNLFKIRDELHVPFRYYLKLYSKPPFLAVSAIDCKKLPELAEDINNLSIHLQKYIKNHRFGKFWIMRYREKSRDFMVKSMVDIGDFLSNFCKISWEVRSKEIYRITRETKESLEDTIVDEYHQIGSRGACGLSIFFPSRSMDVLERYYEIDIDSYINTNLSFVRKTNWDEFLKDLYN